MTVATGGAAAAAAAAAAELSSRGGLRWLSHGAIAGGVALTRLAPFRTPQPHTTPQPPRPAAAPATSPVAARAASTAADAQLSRIHKLVVANRGEIACRVLTTARRLGVPTVAVFSDADRGARHVRLADEAFHIGGAAARDSYLRGDVLLEVCARLGGHSVHPGYGFLSENAAFADACVKAGVAFVGPPGDAIRAMGNKSEAKAIMHAAGVPVVPGYHGEDQSDARLFEEAQRIGFPLLVKAVSGGGGKGMRLARSASELPDALASARREAAAAFGDDRVLIERFVERPRHVEVQVVCDAHGGGVSVFDRDCSLQRRHQKVIEEAPAPGLPDAFHSEIGDAAVCAARAAGYVNAGTVEFIVDMSAPERPFYFMEMNTRLQVEHPVSEEVAGIDLVEWQLRVAAGLPLPLTQQQLGRPLGHAFEARIYAESPRRDFLPGGGTVRRWRVPPGSVAFTPGCVADGPASASAGAAGPRVRVRVDSGVDEGDQVGTFYDPMVAKLVVWGPDRLAALAGLRDALSRTQLAGLPSNIAFLRRLAGHGAFETADDLTTAFIKDHQNELMAPQALPSSVLALAGVARHLLDLRAAASPPTPTPAASLASASLASAADPVGSGLGSAAAGASASTCSPWDRADSKRLWGRAARSFAPMEFPEGGADARADVRLEVLPAGDFDVVCGTCGTPASGTPASGNTGGGTGGDANTAGSISGERVAVRRAALDVAGGRLTAEVEGRAVAADVMRYIHAGSAEVLCLWTDGEAYELRWRLPQWSKEAGQAAAGSSGGALLAGEVAAPLPGRVVKLLVSEGQKVRAWRSGVDASRVAAGEVLVVLEAMKMEHVVKATHAGVVSALTVSAGAQVQDGQAMMVVRCQE